MLIVTYGKNGFSWQYKCRRLLSLNIYVVKTFSKEINEIVNNIIFFSYKNK